MTEQNIENTEISKYDGLLAMYSLLDQRITSKCNDDFLSFIRLMAPTLVSDWKMGKHIRVLADKLLKVKDGKIKRLMSFFLPVVQSL